MMNAQKYTQKSLEAIQAAQSLALHSAWVGGRSAEEVRQALAAHYEGQALVHVAPEVVCDGMLASNPLAGTNEMELCVCGNAERIILPRCCPASQKTGPLRRCCWLGTAAVSGIFPLPGWRTGSSRSTRRWSACAPPTGAYTSPPTLWGRFLHCRKPRSPR